LSPLRVAVVGAGWAGLAAAVHAHRAGHAVQVWEMAPQPGGRARSVAVDGQVVDNGQHILIGAYRATLELMNLVGAEAGTVLRRMPLALCGPDGRGLRLPAGTPVPAFARAVLAHPAWSFREKLALLRQATGWMLRRFRCPPGTTVAQLCAALPARLRQDLIDPLCVAALNTPSSQASATVFLRVLRDALFSGAGSSDLLLPAAPLDALLPQPAQAWLQRAGVPLHLARRAGTLVQEGKQWRLDGEAFDAVVLACSAVEAARLSATVAPAWSAQAAALRYEPIVTVYLRSTGTRLAQPMVALAEGPQAPAQFGFDLGALGGAQGLFAFVVSGARPWVERGLEATAQATVAQALAAFAPGTWHEPPAVLHVAAEKRATFQCTPGLQRPPARIAPGLWAAGDYVAGPYPATLEGAVRSGRDAALGLGG